MYSLGLLYNPLKDHLKGKIDYCILEILKHICSIAFGVISMSESLERVQIILDYDKKKLKELLIERKRIMGFFAHNDLNKINEMLKDHFAMINSSTYYQTEWAITVIELMEWIRSFQWNVSNRRDNPIFIRTLSPSNMLDVISANNMNSSNPKDSYILIKKVGIGEGEVLNTATMPKIDKKYLLSPYKINVDEVDRFVDCIIKIINISNKWLDNNGDEFILDPEYYYMDGPK